LAAQREPRAITMRTAPFLRTIAVWEPDGWITVIGRLEQLQSLAGVLSTKTWLIFEESNGPGAQWY
jgi:hypothetical protein